jgi:hypothetical protein
MRRGAKKVLLVVAEVLLVAAILGLLAANWIPVVVGARPFRVMP